MKTSSPPSQSAAKRTVVAIDPAQHRRVKAEAARRGVKNQELVEMMIDHTLPLLESDKLSVKGPTIAKSAGKA